MCFRSDLKCISRILEDDKYWVFRRLINDVPQFSPPPQPLARKDGYQPKLAFCEIFQHQETTMTVGQVVRMSGAEEKDLLEKYKDKETSIMEVI